jgi:hypothetical protein
VKTENENESESANGGLERGGGVEEEEVGTGCRGTSSSVLVRAGKEVCRKENGGLGAWGESGTGLERWKLLSGRKEKVDGERVDVWREGCVTFVEEEIGICPWGVGSLENLGKGSLTETETESGAFGAVNASVGEEGPVESVR